MLQHYSSYEDTHSSFHFTPQAAVNPPQGILNNLLRPSSIPRDSIFPSMNEQFIANVPTTTSNFPINPLLLSKERIANHNPKMISKKKVNHNNNKLKIQTYTIGYQESSLGLTERRKHIKVQKNIMI